MTMCSECRHYMLGLDEQPCNKCNRFDRKLRDKWDLPLRDRQGIEPPNMFEKPTEGVEMTTDGQPECADCKYRDRHRLDFPCKECTVNDGNLRMFTRSPPEDPAPAQDPVNPNHYKMPGGVEVIQLTRHLNRNRGAAVEYIIRAGQKKLVEGQEVEDLKKARWCIDDEIQRLTGVGDHAK